MSEIRFSSVSEALQHLADKTGKQVKIAKPIYEVEYLPAKEKNGIHLYVNDKGANHTLSKSELEMSVRFLIDDLKDVIEQLSKKFEGMASGLSHDNFYITAAKNGNVQVNKSVTFELKDADQRDEATKFLEEEADVKKYKSKYE